MKRIRVLPGLVLVAAGVAVASLGYAEVNPGTPAETAVSPPPAREGFTVAILADRTAGPATGLAVLERAVAEINLLAPDLVLHIGDFVPGYIRDFDQWQADIAAVRAILGRLEAPLFPVAGNHDVITGTGEPQDRRGEEMYTRAFGPLYYSFDYRDSHFVCLYTEETLSSAPRLSPTQVEWLRRDLAEATANHIFLFMHKPLWEYPEAGWEQVHAILKVHPVRAVFGGHYHHYYKSDLRDGIQYYVLGVTGGQLFSPELAGGLEHYCLLHINPEGYRLALVKPGSVLADDYVVAADYKAMERLRRVARDEVGIEAPITSPEGRGVEEQLAVFVTNPLDVPLPVAVRGATRGGHWRFSPPREGLMLAPGARELVYLGVSSPAEPMGAVAVPDVEVQYTYTDSQGRAVPISVPRRVPLLRAVRVPLVKASISLDGEDNEGAWRDAPALTAAVWEASPYETGQPEPVFRVIGTTAGLYFHVQSKDEFVSGFRGEQILSDAIFVGAWSGDSAALTDTRAPTVVVVYPFGPGGEEQAVRALWDARRPVGPEAEGVHCAVAAGRAGQGWECEGFVPWELLVSRDAASRPSLRFNIGAWDNDGNLFTELHSWAPTEDLSQWGELTFAAP